MSAHREPGWVSLLAEILRGTPKLDGPCRGRSTLFDPAEPFEDEEHIAHRHEAAVRICDTECGARDTCARWIDALSRSRRPAGVIAGEVPPRPGRPQAEAS